MVDGLEKELAGRAQVIKLDVSSSVGRQMAIRYQVRVLPTFVVLDGQGKAQANYGGKPSKGTLLQAIDRLIEN